MKLAITIKYNSGDEASVIAQVPEWVKWEKETGHSAAQWADVAGISDIMFMAYHAIKRESAGRPVKPYEAWLEGISDFEVDYSSPKAMSQEASSGS